MLLCSSLTYNAKEIRMLLKEEEDEQSKWTVEWIIIDPASFTGAGFKLESGGVTEGCDIIVMTSQHHRNITKLGLCYNILKSFLLIYFFIF